MTDTQKKIGAFAVIAALILWWLSRRTKTGVSSCLGFGCTPTSETQNVYDPAGNVVSTNTNEMPVSPYPFADTSSGVPPNAGPAIYLQGEWTAPVGFHVIANPNGSTPLIAPNSAPMQTRLNSAPHTNFRYGGAPGTGNGINIY